MTHVRLISFMLVALFFLSACEQASNEPAPTQSADDSESSSQCELIMGWDPWEPYQFLDVDGSVRGLDVELVEAIVSNAGCQLSYDQENWSLLLSKLRQGTVDLLAGASRTPDREEFAWFTAPYRHESFVMYVRADGSSDVEGESLDEVLQNGAHIGVTMGYVYGDAVSALQTNEAFTEQFVDAPISEVNYAKLVDFEIDGFLEDPFVGTAILRRKGLGDQIVEHSIKIDSGDVHLMISRASVDEATFNRINDSLKELKENGALQVIMDKYRGD